MKLPFAILLLAACGSPEVRPLEAHPAAPLAQPRLPQQPQPLAYEPVCAEIIEVDTPGATAINQPPQSYHQARKTLYEWQQYK